VRHAAQTGTVPVDLAGFRVEGGFLAGLVLELLRVGQGAVGGGGSFRGLGGGLLLRIELGLGLGLRRRGGFLLLADLGLDGVEGWEGGVVDGGGLGGGAEGD
jgi:hypothetical protein